VVSGLSTPDAFTGLFEVYLQTTDGSNLPQQLSANHLAFGGIIRLDKTYKRIDVAATNSINSQNSNAGYLNYNVSTGTVTWNFGTPTDCINGDPMLSTLTIPPGKKQILLFTIAVTSLPGEFINWSEYAGTIVICSNFCLNNIPVAPIDPNSCQVAFQTYKVCSGGNTSFAFEFVSPSIILVSIENPPAQSLDRIQGCINFAPSAISPSFSLAPATFTGYINANQIIKEIRKLPNQHMYPPNTRHYLHSL
jgi:hypothetical protein